MKYPATLKQQKVRDVLRESRKNAAKPISFASSDDFDIYHRDKVERTVYKDWIEGKKRRFMCEAVPLQHPDAKYVARGKAAFGEGAERLAFRLFELAADMRTIVGASLVAK
jgi:hypothetical protein